VRSRDRRPAATAGAVLNLWAAEWGGRSIAGDGG
jgi:hypothetical protein